MDNNLNELKNLEDLLANTLPSNSSIKKYITKPLIGPGENYGSILLSVEVEVQDLIEKKETQLFFVLKICPTNATFKKLFQTSTTFKREIDMYHTIFPTLVEFQKERGISNIISSLPKCYGARTSLNAESTIVDENAVIVLENLTRFGYKLIDKAEGFNLDTTKLILQELAQFHAIPIAIKKLAPDTFNCKLLPHMQALGYYGEPFQHILDLLIENVLDAAKLTVKCIPLIPKVYKTIQYSIQCEMSNSVSCEPFATLTHNDFYTNNVMVRFDKSKPVEIKLLDFQFIEYGTLGNDIMFFLYTSVQFDVINKHFNELIGCYYNTFITTLKNLECDTEPFSYDLFTQELQISAKRQFWHILHMLQPIFMPKGQSIDIDKLMDKNLESIKFLPPNYCKRIADIILDFNKKNWLSECN